MKSLIETVEIFSAELFLTRARKYHHQSMDWWFEDERHLKGRMVFGIDKILDPEVVFGRKTKLLTVFVGKIKLLTPKFTATARVNANSSVKVIPVIFWKKDCWYEKSI